MLAHLDAPPLTTASMIVVLSAAGCGLSLPPVDPTGAGATDGYEEFFIDEQGVYTQPQGGCPTETPLYLLGDGMRDALNLKGWYGSLGEDVEDDCTMAGHRCAEPTDFVESQNAQPDALVGWDSTWADGATLSVYSGHGAHNLIRFRRPSYTPGGVPVCDLVLSDRVALGIGGGNRARVAVFAASCVGYAADLLEADGADDFRDGLGFQSNSWQFLTFFDSPSMDLTMMPNFVTKLGQGMPNLRAWIEATELSEGGIYNQPIVYTTYNSVADAPQPGDYLGTRHEAAQLLTGLHLPAPAPTQFTSFHFTYSLDDGDPWNDDPDLVTGCTDLIPGN